MLAPRGLVLLSVASAARTGSSFFLAAGLAATFSSSGRANKTRTCGTMATATKPAKRVLVTGAGGRTGGIVFEKLLKKEGYAVKGMVRSEKSASKLKKKSGVEVLDENIVMADVTDPASLTKAMEGVEAIVLCTSAVPKIYPFSIAKVLVRKLLRFEDPGRPKFYFGDKGTPKEVDWEGAKALIDAAKAAGVKQFVYVGSMGGTQPDNFLNTIGKQEDGTGGDILMWKRKAEEYLIASGLTYTIIHPGGLIDEEGGKRRLVLGVDDTLLQRKMRSIPRADVAHLSVECLDLDVAKNRSFDVCTDPEGEGEVTADFGALLADLTPNTDYAKAPQPAAM